MCVWGESVCECVFVFECEVIVCVDACVVCYVCVYMFVCDLYICLCMCLYILCVI